MSFSIRYSTLGFQSRIVEIPNAVQKKRFCASRRIIENFKKEMVWKIVCVFSEKDA